MILYYLTITTVISMVSSPVIHWDAVSAFGPVAYMVIPSDRFDECVEVARESDHGVYHVRDMWPDPVADEEFERISKRIAKSYSIDYSMGILRRVLDDNKTYVGDDIIVIFIDRPCDASALADRRSVLDIVSDMNFTGTILLAFRRTFDMPYLRLYLKIPDR